MRFYEVDSSVDAIMSAAMVAQTRASNTGKQGKLSMNGFLQMLANAGIMMDYDGFKTVFDTNPQLKNVIAQFNKDEITFVGDSDDEGAGFEEPQGDMPDDERVAKMAQRATKMRTEEFVEGYEVLPKMDREKYQERDGLEGPIMTRSGKVVYHDNKEGKYYDPDTDMYLSYDDYKMLDKKAMVAVDYNDGSVSEDDTDYPQVQNMNIDKKNVIEILKKHPAETKKMQMSGDLMSVYDTDLYMDLFDYYSEDMPYDTMKARDGDPVQYISDELDELGLMDEKVVEAELPPHLSKMFGKDGSQVETRTDVMKQMRDIVDNKSAMEVEFGNGKQMVDMYTASVLVQVYDKVNDKNKEAIVQNVGTTEKFMKLMPKLFNMISEGDSPHPKGSKKYKAHMAAKHANMNEGKSMEDKIAADIEAGMSTDAIIGKHANKATTNTDEIRKMIQRIKFKNFRNK